MENIPMYQHIKDILKEEIRQGKYRPGDRLPSSNELAVLFRPAGILRSKL